MKLMGGIVDGRVSPRSTSRDVVIRTTPGFEISISRYRVRVGVRLIVDRQIRLQCTFFTPKSTPKKYDDVKSMRLLEDVLTDIRGSAAMSKMDGPRVLTVRLLPAALHWPVSRYIACPTLRS